MFFCVAIFWGFDIFIIGKGKEKMKTIIEILKENNKTETEISTIIQNGKMSLGCANGWNKQDGLLWRELEKLEEKCSFVSVQLGRCYCEDSFIANDGTNKIKVVCTVDSSD
jgi:hypothetical protein